MSAVRRNIVANLAATVVAIVAAVVAVPLLVRGLGLAGYGIVGLHATLAALVAALDLGLAPSVTRELARRAARGESAGDYLATAAALVWCVSLLIAGGVLLLSGAIADRWLAEGASLRWPVALMGLAIAAQWPATCYRAALLGLQRQGLAAALSASFGVLRTLGAAGAVLALDLGPIGYLWIQILLGGLETATTRGALRTVLAPAERRGRVHREALRGTLRFTAAMAVAGSLGLLASQVDRLLLARLVSLELFGAYAIGAALAGGIYRAGQSVTTAVMPRLSQLDAQAAATDVANGHWGTVRAATHAMAILVLPLGVAIALFPSETLRAWGQPEEVVAAASASASLLALGAATNALLHPAYALLLARGAARSAIVVQAASLVVLVPTVLFGASRAGLVGAASAWIVLSAILIAIVFPAILVRFERGRVLSWLGRDVLRPLILCCMAGAIAKLALPEANSRLTSFATIAGAWMLLLVTTLVATDLGRAIAARLLLGRGRGPLGATMR